MAMKILDYNPMYEQSLLELERSSPQGRWIKLRMSRPGFLSRATAFERHRAFVGIDNEEAVAACVGASVPLIHNGVLQDVGYGFDMRVSPRLRGKKIAQRFARHTIENFFHPNGLVRQFITLKKTNHPVLRLVGNVIGNMSLVEFVYLTIPVGSLGTLKPARGDQRFSVALLSGQDRLHDYHSMIGDSLGIWWLDKTYQVTVERVHPLVKMAMSLCSRISSGSKSVPKEGSTLSAAMLFGHHAANLDKMPEVMDVLAQGKVDYLYVCCRRGDPVYRSLKQYSINTYGYYLLFTDKVTSEDTLTIDVRCL